MRWLRVGDVFYDLGANVGFFTLLGSRCVGSAGRVIAFEPEPENLAMLQKHCEWNGVRNVRWIGGAVGASRGRARLAIDAGRSGAKLDLGGDLEVDVVAIDALVATGDLPPPDLMKLDVEGAELAALEGARAALRTSAPVLVVAVHGSSKADRCIGLLEGLGYVVSWLGSGPRDGLGELIALPPSRGAPR